jgi:hypothetical protein
MLMIAAYVSRDGLDMAQVIGPNPGPDGAGLGLGAVAHGPNTDR